MSELPGYDLWKCGTPDDDARVCEVCGEPLMHARGRGWWCDECAPRDVDAEMEAARERREERQHEWEDDEP